MSPAPRQCWIPALVAAVAAPAAPSAAQAPVRDYKAIIALQEEFESAAAARREAIRDDVLNGLRRDLDSITQDAPDELSYAVSVAARWIATQDEMQTAQRAVRKLRDGGFPNAADYVALGIAEHLLDHAAHLQATEILTPVFRPDTSDGNYVKATVLCSQAERCLGDLASAEARLDQAADRLADGEEGELQRAQLTSERIRILIERGLNFEAADLLDRTRERAPEDYAQGLARDAIDVAIALGDYGEAIRACDEAIASLGRTRDLLTRRVQANRAYARHSVDDARRASAYAAALADLKLLSDSPSTAAETLTLRLLEMEALTATGTPERARELLQPTLDLVPEDDPAQVAALARLAAMQSRLLFDNGDAQQRRSIRARMARAYDRLLTTWGRMPPRASAYPFLHYEDRRLVLSELLHAFTASGDSEGLEKGFDYVLRTQMLGSIVRRAGMQRCTVRTARRALASDGRGALVYIFGSERSHAFALDSTTLRHFELSFGFNRIDALSRRLRDGIATREELAAMLLPNALQRAIDAWRAVAVVHAGGMAHVPFEELPLESGASMGDRHAVSYLPSIPLGQLLAQRAVPATESPRRAVMLAAPSPSPAASERWPHVAEQPRGRAIAAAWNRQSGVTDALLLEDESATAEALTGREAAEADLVVVVAHGVADPEPTIVLAPTDASDGLLHGNDLQVRIARPGQYAPIVALFACGAAQEAPRSGDDGAALLAGAFLEAGARAVLVAPNSLRLREAERCAEILFEAMLQDGASVAEALRRAKAATASPLGMLHVVGDGDCRVALRPSGAERSWRTAALFSAIAVLGVLVIAAARSRRSRGRRS